MLFYMNLKFKIFYREPIFVDKKVKSKNDFIQYRIICILFKGIFDFCITLCKAESKIIFALGFLPFFVIKPAGPNISISEIVAIFSFH